MEHTLQPSGQAQNIPQKPWYKKWWVIAILLFIAIPMIAGMFGESEEKAEQPAVAIQEKPLNYEIVKKVPGGTTLVLRIYTTEKENEKLIKLTDKLFEENKKGLTHLTIDYFDDKELASDYFSKLSDERITEAEKDTMFTHYIAGFQYNTVTGYKVLQKNQDGNWVELKKY